MKTATVRELRNDFGQVSKWLESGETVPRVAVQTLAGRAIESGHEDAERRQLAAGWRNIDARTPCSGASRMSGLCGHVDGNLA